MSQGQARNSSIEYYLEKMKEGSFDLENINIKGFHLEDMVELALADLKVPKEGYQKLGNYKNKKKRPDFLITYNGNKIALEVKNWDLSNPLKYHGGSGISSEDFLKQVLDRFDDYADYEKWVIASEVRFRSADEEKEAQLALREKDIGVISLDYHCGKPYLMYYWTVAYGKLIGYLKNLLTFKERTILTKHGPIKDNYGKLVSYVDSGPYQVQLKQDIEKYSFSTRDEWEAFDKIRLGILSQVSQKTREDFLDGKVPWSDVADELYVSKLVENGKISLANGRIMLANMKKRNLSQVRGALDKYIDQQRVRSPVKRKKGSKRST